MVKNSNWNQSLEHSLNGHAFPGYGYKIVVPHASSVTSLASPSMSTLSGEDDRPSAQEDTTSFDITVDLRLTLDKATTSESPTCVTPRAITLRSDSYCLEPSGSKPTEWKITRQAAQRRSSTTPRPTGAFPGTNLDRGLYSVASRQSPQRQSGQFASGLSCTI